MYGTQQDIQAERARAHRRFEAAKAAMQGLLAGRHCLTSRHELCSESIAIADALLKALDETPAPDSAGEEG